MDKTLTTELKSMALQLGFAAVGIAPAAPLESAEHALRERIKSGLLKDYGFARRPAEHFTRPDRALTGAKSMVVVAWPYLTEDQNKGANGRIARFARSRDYHIEIEERLKQLGEWLSSQTGANYKNFVDTGPMIDRAAARQAGIGSYGKNASIITRESGSWVVLGELITDVELDYDEPAPMEQCGNCDICINSCPSGAIVHPFIIDQTKCISHLTQMKGFIPRELRPIIGDRIYGCDVCQEVCPKNSNILKVQSSPLIPHSSSLISFLNIDQEDFDRIIGPTAVAWIGRTRFRRNIAVALGNLADQETVPELIKALHDPEPIIRGHVAWALRQIGTSEATDALTKALKDEDDKIVIEELKESLGISESSDFRS